MEAIHDRVRGNTLDAGIQKKQRYVVQEAINDLIYTIRELANGTSQIIHISDCHPTKATNGPGRQQEVWVYRLQKETHKIGKPMPSGTNE